MNKARAFNPFLSARAGKLMALIAEVQVQMSGYEAYYETRKRARRPADQATYDRTVEAILCDLCVVEFDPNNDSIHLPLSNKVLRSKSRYKGTALGKTLPDILKVMSAPEMNFVVLEKGHSTFRIVDDDLNVAFAGGRQSILNQTFTTIIKEAQAHALATPHSAPALPAQAPRLAVGRPRYQRARLVGDGLVADLAQAYLAEVSQRLRPGSYKSVRFALELLTSHLGRHAVGDLSLSQGKEVLGYITRLSPNVRKYRDGKDAGLADLARLAQEHEGITLAPQTQARILKQMSQFLDWCVGEGELQANPWAALKVKDRPEVHPHGMLTDAQVSILLSTQDRVLHSALLFGLLTGMRSGELCGLMAEDITAKGNLGRFVSIRPNAVRLLKSKAAEREVPLHGVLEQLLDTALPTSGRLFPNLSVDRVVKRYAYLRRRHPELSGTVFHSTRKWFITQCERTGVPEHFTASLVGHHSARSANKLTYGLYSAGISDAQKREIVAGIRLPQA